MCDFWSQIVSDITTSALLFVGTFTVAQASQLPWHADTQVAHGKATWGCTEAPLLQPVPAYQPSASASSEARPPAQSSLQVPEASWETLGQNIPTKPLQNPWPQRTWGYKYLLLLCYTIWIYSLEAGVITAVLSVICLFALATFSERSPVFMANWVQLLQHPIIPLSNPVGKTR